MLRTCPSYGVNEWTILHSFYNGLNYISRSMLDSAAGGTFMTKNVSVAKAILEKTCYETLSNGILRRCLHFLEKSTPLRK
jgi:hypothetical protein